jgi:hypothetical protein
MNGARVFVGEKRSDRAVSMGVTWADGRLAAKTLFAALREAGIDPDAQHFVNLFEDSPDYRLDAGAVERLRFLAASGHELVGMGRRVQRALARLGLAHTKLIHPAARGEIRATDRYRRHVRDALRCPTPVE